MVCHGKIGGFYPCVTTRSSDSRSQSRVGSAASDAPADPVLAVKPASAAVVLAAGGRIVVVGPWRRRAGWDSSAAGRSDKARPLRRAGAERRPPLDREAAADAMGKSVRAELVCAAVDSAGRRGGRAASVLPIGGGAIDLLAW